MNHCVHCGAPRARDGVFCVKCGEPFPVEARSDSAPSAGYAPPPAPSSYGAPPAGYAPPPAPSAYGAPPAGFAPPPTPVAAWQGAPPVGIPRLSNHLRSPARVGLVIGLVGAALVLFPSLSDMSMMRGGYAFMLIGGFVALVGFAVAAIYNMQADALDRLLRGENVLLHWRNPTEWRRAAKEERVADRGNQREAFSCLAVLMLGIGGFFAYMDPRGGMGVLGVMAVLVTMMAIPAVVVPALKGDRALASTGDVIITRDSAWVDGQFHCWSALGSWLEGARVSHETAPPNLVIAYAHLSRYFVDHVTAEIPIPPGCEPTAMAVAAQLASCVPA